ncbi:hypothetical protein ENUP19_0004G0028 [Entamoeba nuttalli]|uniref:Sphingosine-1-phosphate phosphatase, putative n=2 Tax=Entamoeba nuttalli TaxID=412467 RepID=K2GPN3_ENTNP|nr:sphingosine-1-phosphate phosphatase, putative [Entamoeba nuttalli P19]EKE36918.1 sphingosine-1-phosphate phosphatase, putative [Entamoeba nuttalli P19]|eukprot:XP_008860751.1 sphingosine-1-phosphate phosphatase, putative [Entamoeba nuttalli P19]
MIILFKDLRDFLYKTVIKSMPSVYKLQTKKNKILDIFFLIMTHLAGVGVYCALIPTAWWIHPSSESLNISNELLYLISITTYLGNFMKNLFACPRPSGVWQPFKEIDFGLPSTHTMNAVANGLFFIIYLKPNLWICLLITVYVFIVAVSRIYMGVHSPADVIAGALLGFVSMAFFEFFPDFPQKWYFIPIMLVCHVILLSLHSLCFTRYTPCYWRSVLGFGYILLNFTMEVLNCHVSVPDMPSYSCIIHSPLLLLKCFILGFSVSGIGYFVLKLLKLLFSHLPSLLDWYSAKANIIRIHCHLDPLEFTPEMNHNRLIYANEFFSTYIGAVFIAWMCKYVSPTVVQKTIPELFQPDLCL